MMLTAGKADAEISLRSFLIGSTAIMYRCSMLPVEARGGGAGGGDAVSVVRPQGSNLESKDAMNLA